MKLRIGAVVLSCCILFFSCKKSSIKPDTKEGQGNLGANTSSEELIQGAPKIDTSANYVNGYLRLQLSLDSVNSDNVLITFKPSASTAYVAGEDAPTLQGFGSVSLSSFSSDNIPLAINVMPLTQQGVKIGLRVTAKSDGIYKLSMKAISGIPSAYNVWLIDHYKKDSVNFRLAPSYSFSVANADTASFGSNRFKLSVSEH
jgi:hypothetical protein